MGYEREQAQVLRHRLKERSGFIHIVVGLRQVGKSTMVRQVLSGYMGGKQCSIGLQAERIIGLLFSG